MRCLLAITLLLLLFSVLAAEEALFFVTDAEGDTLFAVYPNGVVIKNEMGDKLFTAESDSIRAYVYDDPQGRTSRGGFAIGGVASTTRNVHDYFHVSGDSVRIYLEENDPQNRTSRGGFAIGGVASTTRNSDSYFNIDRNDTPEVIFPSQPRMLWYPAKEAIRMGRVLVASPDSVGQNSLATGYESKAIGDYSQALGYQARAIGDFSTAIGYMATADGENTYALGSGARAIGIDSFALGFGAEATGRGSFAFGSAPRDSLGNPMPQFGAAHAEGMYSTAFGLGTYSNGVGAMAFGARSSANEYCALAMGSGADATGSSSVAIGLNAQANDYLSIAIGGLAEAPAQYALALGYHSTASGQYATAIGRSAIASGDYSFCSSMGSEQNGDGATGDYSIAMGRNAAAHANYSVSIGYDNEIADVADYGVGIGRNNIINSYNGFAAGGYNIANGDYSTALGSNNNVVGSGSFAAGYDNETTGHYATAIGRSNTAAYGAVAMGYDNTAAFQYSFASGRGSQTTGDYGTAMGYYCSAGQDAVAGGRDCVASAGGVALGYGSTAPGSFSVALGYNSDALGQGSVAIGDYAVADGHGVAIGEDVSATYNSVVLGKNASSGTTMGSFVFGDYESINTMTADAQNQFRTRCKGGYKFHTNGALDASKTVVITGNEAWLGVGTDDPQERLHVAGKGYFIGDEDDTAGADGLTLKLNNTNNSTGVMSGFMFQNGSTANTYKAGVFLQDRATYGVGNLLFCNDTSPSGANVTADDAKMIIYTDGKVGIGTPASDTSLGAMLMVAGRVAPYTDNTHDLGGPGYRWDDVYATNGTINTSDRRLKENIVNLRYGLAEIMRLRPVSFTWIDNPAKGEQLGLIAQEVQEVIPEMVVQESPDDYMGMRYIELVPVLVNAVQQQQVVIERQQAELDAIAGLSDELESSNEKVAQLESELAALRALVEQLAAAQSPAAVTAKLP